MAPPTALVPESGQAARSCLLRVLGLEAHSGVPLDLRARCAASEAFNAVAAPLAELPEEGHARNILWHFLPPTPQVIRLEQLGRGCPGRWVENKVLDGEAGKAVRQISSRGEQIVWPMGHGFPLIRLILRRFGRIAHRCVVKLRHGDMGKK